MTLLVPKMQLLKDSSRPLEELGAPEELCPELNEAEYVLDDELDDGMLIGPCPEEERDDVAGYDEADDCSVCVLEETDSGGTLDVPGKLPIYESESDSCPQQLDGSDEVEDDKVELTRPLADKLAESEETEGEDVGRNGKFVLGRTIVLKVTVDDRPGGSSVLVGPKPPGLSVPYVL